MDAVPRSLARRLEGAVFELKAGRDDATQQEVLAALLWKYCDPSSKSAMAGLGDLIDEYREAADPPRPRNASGSEENVPEELAGLIAC